MKTNKKKQKNYLCGMGLLLFSGITSASPVDITNLGGFGIDLTQSDHLFTDELQGYVALFPDGDSTLEINSDTTIYNPAFLFQKLYYSGTGTTVIGNKTELNLVFRPDKELLNFWCPDQNSVGAGNLASPIYSDGSHQTIEFVGGGLVVQNETHYYPNESKDTQSYLIVANNDGRITFKNTDVEIQHAQNGLRVGNSSDSHDSLIQAEGGNVFHLSSDLGDSQHHGLTTYYGGTISIATNKTILIHVSGTNSNDGDNSGVQISWGGNIALTSDSLSVIADTQSTDSDNYAIYASSYRRDGKVNLTGLSPESSRALLKAVTDSSEGAGIGIYTYGYADAAESIVKLSNFQEVQIDADYGIYTRGRDGDVAVDVRDVKTFRWVGDETGIFVETGYPTSEGAGSGNSEVSISAETIEMLSDEGGIIKAVEVQGTTLSNVRLNASDTLRLRSKRNPLFELGTKGKNAQSKLELNASDGSGRTVLEGDGIAEDGAVAVVGLNTEDSVWTGAAYDARNDGTRRSGNISVTASHGARWNVLKNRNRTDAAGSRNSYLTVWHSVASSNIDLRGEAECQPLDIDNLLGEGTVFWLRADINADRGSGKTDQVSIHKGRGSHGVRVDSTGKEPWVEFQTDYLVRHLEEDGYVSALPGTNTTGDALSFHLTNEGGVVDVGLYLYELAARRTESGTTEWYLKRQNSDPNPDTPSGDLVTALIGHPIEIYRAQLSDLRERLGEVRYGVQEGAWARGFVQKDRQTGSASNAFSQRLEGVNVGFDGIRSTNEDRQWLWGFNFRYVTAEQNSEHHDDVSGDLTAYGFNLYATYADHLGNYADFVFSTDRYEQELNARMIDGRAARGNYDTYGAGVSIEFGRMFSSMSNDEGWGPWYDQWFAEPQFQLAYYWLNGKRYQLTNGMSAEQEDSQSLTGRLGIVLGKKWNYGVSKQELDKRFSQLYVKGGIRHDFLGDRKISVNGKNFSDEDDGSRWYYGFGMDWAPTDRLHAYFECERESGHGYKKDYKISFGTKWDF